MAHAPITKLDAARTAPGGDGQIKLAAGVSTALRMWREEPVGDAKPATTRPYETVGYVIAGRAELEIAGETVTLGPGDSWVVPHEASHTYRILETFTAIEATSPPAS